MFIVIVISISHIIIIISSITSIDNCSSVIHIITLLGRTLGGIWHTGIVVHGREYYFGGEIYQDSEGGMMRLESLIELKFLNSSFSSCFILLKFDNQFPVTEQFEATASQSTAPSPPRKDKPGETRFGTPTAKLTLGIRESIEVRDRGSFRGYPKTTCVFS